MSDQGGPGGTHVFIRASRRVVEDTYPGLLERANVDDFDMMAIATKIGVCEKLEVKSEEEIPHPAEKRVTLAKTDAKEKLIFVGRDEMSRNIGTLYHVKPTDK
jgi:hypothetical protein